MARRPPVKFRTEKTPRDLGFENKLMLASILSTLVAIVLFLVAVGTSSWAVLTWQKGQRQEKFHVGIWGEWKTTQYAEEPPQNYHRTQVVFGLITLLLMLVGNSLAIFSYVHTRYVYKRLTGGIYLCVVMCILVVTQVMSSSVKLWVIHEKEEAREKKQSEEVTIDESGAEAYSSILVWTVFGAYLVGALTMFFISRKHKGFEADEQLEIEDRPINMGRI